MTSRPRTRLRAALRSAGFLVPAQHLRAGAGRLYRVLTLWTIRKGATDWWRARTFARRHAARFAAAVPAGAIGSAALIVGRIGRGLDTQMMLPPLLRAAGYAPAALLLKDTDLPLAPYYKLTGVHSAEVWASPPAEHFLTAAATMLRQCHSARDILNLDFHGVRVGRSALAVTLRESQVGLLELDDEARDPRLVPRLAGAIAAASAAQGVLERLAPAMTLSYEMEYTPKRELFDACLAAGGSVIAAYRAPRQGSLLLKRYTRLSEHRHPSSLSDESWRKVRQMSWTPAHRRALVDEVRACYEQGDWWGIPGPAPHRVAMSPDELKALLGLNPAKKTAVIFPHVPWDASFAWGEDLFADYQTWLIETVRAACANTSLNWVIKVHPANLGKSVKMSEGADPTEVSAIRQHLGVLPPHVVLLHPGSEVSTFPMFSVMDYCLTVRGTVGIEAASMGIPVLTAGTGRYDRCGLTIDSGSSGEYLERVRTLQDIPPMSPDTRELAERFAYGLFLLRPVPLEPAMHRALTATGTDLESAWRQEPALVAFVEWLRDPSAEDFLMPFPEHAAQS